MSQALFENLKRFSKLYILASIIFLIASGAGVLKLEKDFSYKIWFRESEPLIKTYDEFQKKFGNDDLINIVVHSPSGIFDRESLKTIQKVTTKLWGVTDVVRVDSITNFLITIAQEDDVLTQDFIPENLENIDYELKKSLALKHEVLPNYLINKKADVTNIYAKIRPYFDGAPDDQKIISEVRSLISNLEDKGDHTFYVNGSLAINNSFREIAESDVNEMMPIVFLCIIVLLFFCLRSIWGVILPLVVIAFTTTSCFGIIALIGIKMNNMISMIPMILMAICIADSLHILVSIFLSLGRGQSKEEAISFSIKKNLVPSLLTTVSTCIGFLSLTISELVPLAQMGIAASIGSALAWLFTFFFMLPLCFHLPLRKSKLLESSEHKQKRVKRFVTFLDNKKVFLIVLVVSSFGILSYYAIQNKVNSNPYYFFSDNVDIKKSNDFTLENLGGFYGPQLEIRTTIADGVKDPGFLRKVQDYVNWLEAKDYISRVNSILDPIKSMNRSFHSENPKFYKIPESQQAVAELLLLYSMGLPQGRDLNDQITVNNDALRLSVLWTAQDSAEALKYMDEFESKAQELGLDLIVSGKIPIYQRMDKFVVDTFIKSISMALILIAVLLFFIFKSIKLSLFSLLPNIIPLGYGGGILYLLGKDIDMGTALVSSVCLGIVVDDTIHFLTNYNNYRGAGLSKKDSIEEIFLNTGPALFWTTATLILGFGSMIFADFVPNANFGLLSAIILGLALVIDLIFLPCLLLLNKKD